jgi:hypothetical protein
LLLFSYLFVFLVIDILDRASRNRRVAEELDASDEEPIVIAAHIPKPPPVPDVYNARAKPTCAPGIFGVYYEIYRPDIKAHFIILQRTKETKMKIFRTGPAEISVEAKFRFEPTAINAVCASIDQIYDWVSHNLPEQVATKVFKIPFEIGAIVPQVIDAEAVFVIKLTLGRR